MIRVYILKFQPDYRWVRLRFSLFNVAPSAQSDPIRPVTCLTVDNQYFKFHSKQELYTPFNWFKNISHMIHPSADIWWIEIWAGAYAFGPYQDPFFFLVERSQYHSTFVISFFMSILQTLKREQWKIFQGWDVPWDWKITLYVMMPYLMRWFFFNKIKLCPSIWDFTSLADSM